MKTFKEATSKSLKTKWVDIKINLDSNPHTKNIHERVLLAIGDHSKDMFDIEQDIDYYTGLSKKEAEEYKETPTDAYVYGMVNLMNDSHDIFMFHNKTRLLGEIKRIGIIPAVFEQLSHECLHLTRLLLNKVYYEKQGKTMYEVLEDNWPTMGEVDDKSNPLVIYDEESFCGAHGLITQQIASAFVDMLKEK